MNIKFSPPDITDKEIENVVEVLKSGWITTGPKTKLFEQRIADYVGTNKAVCLNSATACLESILRVLKIGPGDEVITSAYTYTASASVVEHVGAKLVLVDVKENSFEMDYEKLEEAITEKTKAIIPVDIAGVPCDYEKIFSIVERKKNLFCSNNDLQKLYGRIIVVADGAHSFGAIYKDKMIGNVADFTSFSFHAVKNLTTAEGGALTWKSVEGLDDEVLYKEFMLLSLHGQSKDALAKNKLGAWEYDIVYPAFKCNMTDIMAAIGLAQLDRYEGILKRRHEIIARYNEAFKEYNVVLPTHIGEEKKSSGHLYLLRINGIDEEKRNELIIRLAEQGVATNVHYKPLPMMTAYKNLGFSIENYPNAYAMYQNEITLPLHTMLTEEEIEYIIEKVKEELKCF
ncbi:MAG: DegT/DnrJ/EryC1/StrS family aminotransferase [Clostridia bacterium]|nr:DegT/DnrJ/EryC1/StrS family aminotransferase [Clostridia bacterium]